MDTSRDNGQKGKESPHMEFLHDNDQKNSVYRYEISTLKSFINIHSQK